MFDWFDRLMIGFASLCVIGLGFLFCVVVADVLSTADGAVVDKYYDDQDLVCSKGCTVVPECWTIVVDSEPWWNKDSCVSESKYRTIKIGDHFRE